MNLFHHQNFLLFFLPRHCQIPSSMVSHFLLNCLFCNSEHIASPMWGLLMLRVRFGGWGRGFLHWAQMSVCSDVQLTLDLCLFSIIVIVGGSSADFVSFFKWVVKALGQADGRSVVSHLCASTSKLSLGISGETPVVPLIVPVWVVSLCDIHVCIQCSALRGSMVAAVKTQGCMYLQAPPPPLG